MIDSIGLPILTAILAIHFIADFIFQSDRMAKGKSSSNIVLGTHILVYTLFLLPFGVLYALINGALHFATDWVSSRMSKKMWEKGDTHNFFVVVGADQLIHVLCLVWTFGIFSIQA